MELVVVVRVAATPRVFACAGVVVQGIMSPQALAHDAVVVVPGGELMRTLL